MSNSTVQLPRPMQPVKQNWEQKSRIKQYASLIEEYFQAYGLECVIVEVNTEQYGIQYCFKIALGCAVERFIKYYKVLGAILASPNNRISIEAPIPGRDLIGITIPWVHPYMEIPPLEYPEVNSKYFRLLVKSVQYYRRYMRVGKFVDTQPIHDEAKGDTKSIINDYLFLKSMFDTWSTKPDLRLCAYLIEKTFEALGVYVQVIEVDIESDHYLFQVKPITDKDAMKAPNYAKDIALSLASPNGRVEIVQLNTEKRIFGVVMPRVNYSGKQMDFKNKQVLPEPRGFLRKYICNYLFDKCREYFRRYEYWSKDDRYLLFNTKYSQQYYKLSDKGLIDEFNAYVGKEESLHTKASRLSAIQGEFDRRDFDYSDIVGIPNGLQTGSRIRLQDNKIVIV